MQFENPQEKKRKRRLLIAALAVGALLLCCICAAVFGFLELDLNIEPAPGPIPPTETWPTPDRSSGDGGYVPPASVVQVESWPSRVSVYVRIPVKGGQVYLSSAMLEGQSCEQGSLNTARMALQEASSDVDDVTVRLEFPRPRVEPSPSWTMILGDYEQQMEVYP